MPAALTVTFVATNAYDVLFSGVQRAVLSHPSEIVLLIPVTALGLAIGSAVASGRERRLAAGCVVTMALLGLAIAGSPNPVNLLVLGGYLAVVGLPRFGVGYTLTTGHSHPDR